MGYGVVAGAKYKLADKVYANGGLEYNRLGSFDDTKVNKMCIRDRNHISKEYHCIFIPSFRLRVCNGGLLHIFFPYIFFLYILRSWRF